jgi:hypothetical protein
MPDAEDVRNAFELLELPEDSGIRDVRGAQKRLTSLYERGSLATLPVEDELSDTEREQLLADIKAAYDMLVAHLEGIGGSRAKTINVDEGGLSKEGIDKLDGYGLKRVRELMGVGLGEIELKTRINSRYLSAIEEHKFKVLPEEVYVQGYVSKYARLLGLDHERAVREFGEALRAWKTEQLDVSDDLRG